MKWKPVKNEIKLVYPRQRFCFGNDWVAKSTIEACQKAKIQLKYYNVRIEKGCLFLSILKSLRKRWVEIEVLTTIMHSSISIGLLDS